jgi:predicted 3-demethylubiquinone-9 3-methyltransferase (glyoxalase superfamily)
MTRSITPFLMFEGRAAEAMAFYASLFPDAEITGVERYGAGEPGPEGTVKQAWLRIGDQTLRFFDSPVKHGFTFTPSLSFFVDCESEEEIGALAAALGEGGQFLMPLGSYGFSRRFAWVADRFGVSWQLNLP